MKLKDISVVVVTHNDAVVLGRCLDAVDGFGEVLLVDEFSTDDTVSIARLHGAVVYSRKAESAAAQKTWAVERTSHRWVLMLDPVDVVSAELRGAIGEVECDEKTAGVVIYNRHHYLGRAMAGCRLGAGRSMRLFDRARGRIAADVDEPDKTASVVVEGDGVAIHAFLDRFPYEKIEDHIKAIEHASGWRARRYVAGGGRSRILEMTVRPPVDFFKNYVLRRGFLDGWRGFVFCLIASYGVFLEYARAWEIRWRQNRR